MPRIDLMSIWFDAWNADVQAAREDYDRSIAAERTGREYKDPDWCFNQVHELTAENIAPGTDRQCLRCRREADRERQIKGRAA